MRERLHFHLFWLWSQNQDLARVCTNVPKSPQTLAAARFAFSQLYSTMQLFFGCRLLTVTIFLDRINDLDPFEKLDLILHSGTLAFSGSPIRSDPTYRSIWLYRGQKCLFFLLVNLFDRKRVTFKGNTQTLGVKYELDRTETIAADHYCQA
jgi:hypothetical protein